MRKKNRTLRNMSPYLWLLPSFALMVVMVFLPIITVFRLSFMEIGKSGKVKGFAGLENFQTVLSNPTFWMVLKNTVIWTIAVVGISTVLGLIIGMVLNSEFHGRKIARAVVVFPWATSLVIQASIWKFIINKDYGALNTLLLKLHLIKSSIDWTSSSGMWFGWEIWVGIFVTVPFVTFCVLSGLQSIDSSYYEAATIDGASFWQKTWNITLPLVKPSLTVATVLNIIYVFNSFPIIWTMTEGAPAHRTDTLVTYLYSLGYVDGKLGPAAAVSVISFVILCIVAIIYMKFAEDGGES